MFDIKNISINVNSSSITFDKNCSNHQLKQHILFLRQRLKEQSVINKKNINLINERIKQLNFKKAILYLPIELFKDHQIVTKLNYYFCLLSMSSLKMIKINYGKKYIYFPYKFYLIAINKSSSLKNTFMHIDSVIEEIPCQELST